MLINLSQNTVHVWHVSLNDLSPDQQLLSAEECSRADRFRRPQDRDRYIVGRCSLRIILGSYLGIAPAAVQLRISAHGKPELCTGLNAAPAFSLTHAGDRALVAVTEGHSVGIDLEQVRNDLPFMDVAAAWFLPVDVDRLRSLEGEDQLRLFFRFWTRREAYGKMRGTGLSEAIGFSLDSDSAGADHRFLDLEIDDGFVASLCVARSVNAVSVRRWPDDVGP